MIIWSLMWGYWWGLPGFHFGTKELESLGITYGIILKGKCSEKEDIYLSARRVRACAHASIFVHNSVVCIKSALSMEWSMIHFVMYHNLCRSSMNRISSNTWFWVCVPMTSPGLEFPGVAGFYTKEFHVITIPTPPNRGPDMHSSLLTFEIGST